MYYIQIEDNKPVGYPITENTLREMNPNVSFTSPINAEDVLPLGFAPFRPAIPPIPGKFKVVAEGEPLFDGAQVLQRFILRDMGEQEIVSATQREEDLARARQRNLLISSDWTELPSVQSKHTQEWIDAWAEYRTLVRDVDKQASWPFDLEWPKEPLVSN
jgi:hypothetical protein